MAKTTVAHTAIANVIEVRRNRPMVSSLKIAELFERRHDSVLRAIRAELRDEISLRKLAESTYVSERGRSYPIYWLDERQALILMPFLGGAKAREGQRKLVDAYLYYRDHYGNPPRKDLIGFKRAAMFPMTDAIMDRRAEAGKQTDKRHFMCENKLCNFALSGKFATLDETALSNEELELLAKLRAMNGSLIAAGLEYETRKPLLAQYATRERTKAISASPKTREPSLCATSA